MGGPIDPSEVLSTESSLYGVDLSNISPAEFRAVTAFKRQLEFIQNNKYSYLVLGDFSKYPQRRLGNACQTLSGKGRTAAKTLIKLPNFDELDDIDVSDSETGLETHLQFHSVAENVTAILMVAEGRNAGSAVELGELMRGPGEQTNHLFNKTYLAVRNYRDLTVADIAEDHPAYDDLVSRKNGDPEITNPMPYSAPQQDKFEIFKRNGRYWEWSDRSTLWDALDEIHAEVTSSNS